MPGEKPNIVTDSDFRELVLEADGIVVVDFWAPWCGPCIQMAPGLEAFSEANEERVKVFKLDADDNPKTAEKYGIRSVPTLIFFKNGEPIFVSRGAMSQASLQKKLEELLGRPE
jgi:thioredoxin 1